MNPFLVAPTPREQTPAAIAAIAEARRIVLACHVNPDGDALGSLLGLGLGLIAIGKEVVLLSSDGVPANLAFLPGSETVQTDSDRRDFDLAIVVDSGDLTRIGNARPVVESAPVIMDVDHHVTGEPFGQIQLLDGNAAATAEIVFDLLVSLGTEITVPIAENLLCGILTDTGSFRFRNTTPQTFQIASALTAIGASPNPIAEAVFENRSFASQKILGRALERMQISEDGRVVWSSVTQADFAETGAADNDTDGVSTQLQSVRGTQVALFLRETKSGLFRVSLRSKEPFDVSAVAAQFGGGGHKLASGCSLPGPLADAEAKLLTAVNEQHKL
ncbi:MAG: bifunctional oligoribonuclease/PAP phosphatase NrnA [Akkermansiaceae bacterium]|nr:bifunctional oligoribonuclease/PAP phosphatase NrnA [Armatimonadota bacterium]